MKKILSLSLVICLITLLLCSCSNQKDDDDKTYASSLLITYDSVYSDYDESVINAYNEVCNAVINGDTEVRINTGLFSKVQRLIYTSFPLYDLVKNFECNEDGSGISIEYINDLQTHRELVSDFDKKIESIKNECSANGSNDLTYTINLYNYISRNIVPADDSTITCYQTITQGQGTSFSYSNMFEYLLAQKGIEVYHIIAYDMANVPFGISQAVINDSVYYFDVMSEYYDNNGENLVYFGMTSEDVKASGLQNMTYTNDEKAMDASDLEFDVCRSCKSWEIKDDNLIITRADDKKVAISIS